MASVYGSLFCSLLPCVVTGPEPRIQVQSWIPVCHAAQTLPSWACRQTKDVDAHSVFLFGEKSTAPRGAWPKTLQITMHLSNHQMESQTKSAWERWNGYRNGTPSWTPEYNLTGPFKVFSLNTYYTHTQLLFSTRNPGTRKQSLLSMSE